MEEDSDAVRRAKDLEVQAVRAAEEGNLEDALELLTRAVNEAPNYASPYNNRAQVCYSATDELSKLQQNMQLQKSVMDIFHDHHLSRPIASPYNNRAQI